MKPEEVEFEDKEKRNTLILIRHKMTHLKMEQWVSMPLCQDNPIMTPH
jgi:hypothetical protein